MDPNSISFPTSQPKKMTANKIRQLIKCCPQYDKHGFKDWANVNGVIVDFYCKEFKVVIDIIEHRLEREESVKRYQEKIKKLGNYCVYYAQIPIDAVYFEGDSTRDTLCGLERTLYDIIRRAEDEIERQKNQPQKYIAEEVAQIKQEIHNEVSLDFELRNTYKDIIDLDPSHIQINPEFNYTFPQERTGIIIKATDLPPHILLKYATLRND